MPRKLQSYESDAIEVTFEPARCIHSAVCLRSLPDVFDVAQRRWIMPEKGTAEAIVDAVEHCPSGALRYHRRDGETDEQPDPVVTVRPMRNGPLIVRGEVEVVDGEGAPLPTGPRMALCRCGGSGNKPFCDNTHRSNGFTA